MTIFGWLSGPLANPFRIHHGKRGDTSRQGDITRKGQGYHLTWEKRDLPDAGAGQYSWETLGLPPYAPYGFGNINVTNPLRETFPASYVFQAVGIVGNPPKSIVQGQFTTQPLMDPSNAVNNGIVAPGAIALGPNIIANSSPLLNG